MAEKSKKEDELKKKLEAAIASGDKEALMKALKEAKMAGVDDPGDFRAIRHTHAHTDTHTHRHTHTHSYMFGVRPSVP